jgi:hypothetical protein
MSATEAAAVPRKRVWRAFWITWLIVFAGLNGWLGFIVSRAHPFSRKYTLGEDVVNEEHKLSWLAWGTYAVEVREPTEYLDGMGGDIAVELVSSDGETVIAKRFLFGEKASAGGGSAGAYSFWSFGGLRPGLFDRYTMRVTTIKTGEFPRRNIELRLAGTDAGYASLVFVVWNVFAGIVLVVSMIILTISLGVIERRHHRRLVSRPTS